MPIITFPGNRGKISVKEPSSPNSENLQQSADQLTRLKNFPAVRKLEYFPESGKYFS